MRKKKSIAAAKAKALAEAQKLTMHRHPSMLQGPMTIIKEDVAERSSDSNLIEKGKNPSSSNNNVNEIQEVRSRKPSSFPDSKDDSLIRKAQNMIEEITPDKKDKILLNPNSEEVQSDPTKKTL